MIKYIEHEAKLSALLASRPRPSAIFPVVLKRMWCFNWFSVMYGAIQKLRSCGSVEPRQDVRQANNGSLCLLQGSELRYF